MDSTAKLFRLAVAVIGLHTGGIDARPRQYERRVAGFFDDALL
jgi:hypothetical protein